MATRRRQMTVSTGRRLMATPARGNDPSVSVAVGHHDHAALPAANS